MLEYLDQYRPTHLEKDIADYYRRNHIYNPQDIDLTAFAEENGIIVKEHDSKTVSFKLKHRHVVFVDRRLPWAHQRVELAHEIGHITMHSGRQDDMRMPIGFRSLQERQADSFAFYVLTPTFMIANCLVNAYSREEMVEQLASTFDVPVIFMDCRLTLLEQRIKDVMYQIHTAKVVSEMQEEYDYTYRHPTNPRIEYWVKDGQVVLLLCKLLADMLECGDKYMQYQGIVKYAWNERCYNVSVFHGAGGGRKAGSSVNRLEGQTETVHADIYLMGHTHKQHVHKKNLYVPDPYKLKVRNMEQTFVNTGHALDYEGSYAEAAGLPPSRKGFPVVYLSGRRVGDEREKAVRVVI